MIIDITLITLFLVSVFILWYRLSIKIPELIAIKDQVIAERLTEDSAKFRLFILHFKSFFQDKRYNSFLLRFIEKLLYRFHIFLLRIDNINVLLLKKIRGNGTENINGALKNKDEYWNELREETSTPKVSRIQEIRSKE